MIDIGLFQATYQDDEADYLSFERQLRSYVHESAQVRV